MNKYALTMDAEVAAEQALEDEIAHTQRMSALAAANRVCHERAQLKRDFRAGQVSMQEIISGEDERPLGHLRTSSVLAWQRGWGLDRARRVLNHAGIIGDPYPRRLTKRQRFALVEALEREISARRR